MLTLIAHPLVRRCRELEKRGLLEGLAAELRWCGNEALIAEVEAASDADIAALNAEWVRRN